MTWLDGVVLNPVWNYLVEFFPMWLAPNLITFVGFLMTFIPAIMILILDPSFSESALTAPFYYFCAVSIIVYQYLDALDGKQARRTKSSSVLGELFDHGCDSVTTLAIYIILAECLQLGSVSQWGLIVFIISGPVTFQLFTMEKRFTRVLRTGVGQFGVIESHYLCSLLFLLTGIFGNNIWTAGWTVFGYTFSICKIISWVAIIVVPHCIITTVPLMKKAAIEKGEFSIFCKYLGALFIAILGY